MKVLVVGSGGREHAILWKLSQSKTKLKLFCAPGNGGISEIAQLVPIKVNEIEKLKEFALKEKIDLTVVGPELPLAMGIVDEFQSAGLKIFGPRKKAAEIESSKSFAKDLMNKYHIPTAAYRVFTDEKAAVDFVKQIGTPVVVKANGLAAGKGVIVASEPHELKLAVQAVKQVFHNHDSKLNQQKVVIEEFLEGEELSLMAFVDGETVIPMQTAQDHKRIFDQDRGPNTGGMGAYSPVPQFSEEMIEKAVKSVLIPTARALVKEGRSFTGVLYAGLMITESGIKVIEFNARFGDPETQVVLPRMDSDLFKVLMACADHNLSQLAAINWNKQAVIAVVLASQGYPGKYSTGKQIYGLEEITNDNIMAFHSGTAKSQDAIFTSGGRVLAVTAKGNDLATARRQAYLAAGKIEFDGIHYRKDIGAKAFIKA